MPPPNNLPDPDAWLAQRTQQQQPAARKPDFTGTITPSSRAAVPAPMSATQLSQPTSTQPQAQSPLPDPDEWLANRPHPLDSVVHGLSDMWSKINPLEMARGLNAAASDPISAGKAMGQSNTDIYNKMKSAWDAGDHAQALRHAVNYALNGIPGFGTAIEEAQDKGRAGDYAGMIGSSVGTGLGLALPEHLPAVARLAGRGLQKAAAPIAESALGVRAMQRAFGKTPGTTLLQETSGITPRAVAESARNRLAVLNPELEARATAAPGPASLAPARNLIDQRAALARAGNSTFTPSELAEMRTQLTYPRPGFTGVQSQPLGMLTPPVVDELQSPATLLRMKREFGNDFTKWNPLHPQREMQTARNVYGQLDREFDRTVPGGAELNQTISSLIPVAERGEATSLQAGVPQKVINRFARPTGALVGTAAGYGIGGVPGAIAGAILPDILSGPTSQMAVARGLYGAGKGLRSAVGMNAVKQTGRAGAATLRNPYRDENQE